MIDRIEAFVFRAPTPRPVATSFGVMRDRPAVFVRVTDRDGAFGWGEVFANWPAAGAEHRANLLIDDIAPLLLGAASGDPAALWRDLSARVRIRALQCGEPGPFAQCLAGVDIALWDMAARRAELPLATFLNADAARAVPTYASGIALSQAAQIVPKARAAGFTAFKVKVGFDMAADIAGLTELSAQMEQGESLRADANQAWTPDTAAKVLEAIADLPLHWMEEPIPADAPPEHWARLAAQPIPLAGGENIAGEAAFSETIARGHLAVVQPDVAKWGGVSGCVAVARDALARGRSYCPHFLGGGIGLMASAHVLGSVGGPGLLEVDVNPNPLRDAFDGTLPDVTTGHLPLLSAPGLGITALPVSLTPYLTHSRDRSAG